MHPETARRGRLLYVALAFLGLDLPPAAQPSGLRALHAWLDTWHGIGLSPARRQPRWSQAQRPLFPRRHGVIGLPSTHHVSPTLSTGWCPRTRR